MTAQNINDKEKTKNVRRKTSDKIKEEGAERGKADKRSASEKLKPKDKRTQKEESGKPETGQRAPGSGSMQNKIFAVIVVIAVLAVSFYAVFLYMQGDEDDNGNGTKENELPIAEAGDNREIETLEPYQFSGTSSVDQDGEIVSYNWNFGDGEISSEQSPTHTYKKPGLYLLRLTVTDNDGGNSSDTAFITVLNRNPHVSINVPSGLTIYQVGHFNGTAEDPDGFISLYEWDFDGDGVFDWYAKTTGATSHFYSKEGVYKAIFRAVDDNGKANTTELSVTVSAIPNNPPVAYAGSDQSAGVGPITLFGTASDPEGNMETYQWDFDGDGTFDWSSSENMELNHTYSQEGKYRAVFRVTDSFGLYTEDTVDITIDNKIITERVSAKVLVDWNETQSGGPDFNYYIKLNNTFEPANVTVHISIKSAEKTEKFLYPSTLMRIDNRTLFCASSLLGEDGDNILVEVLYLDRLIGQREIELTGDFSKRLISPQVDQSAEYSYATDIYQESRDTIRQEDHSGKLEVISANQILQNYYSGDGNLKLINELEGSRTIFNLTSSSIYRNETWESGRLVQDSFEFAGTGGYKFISTQGASFDIQLSEFVLREQNGNKTDYHFSGSGAYSNPPLDGTIDISYDLLGLDIHDNWDGEFFNCEMYKIETLISYQVSDTKISVHNTSFVWVVSEEESYEDTTIYVEYLFRYSENDFVFEQLSDKYYPKDAPKAVAAEPDIFEAIEFTGVVPISFSEGDSVVIQSKLGIMIRYEGTSQYQKDIHGKAYQVTDITGSVIDDGAGNGKLTIVANGKYTGWIIEKDEEYTWNDEIYKRRLELI